MITDLPPLAPTIERTRHPVRPRTLTVSAAEAITPAMLRLTLTGDDLHDLVSAGFDDHLKLAMPGAGGAVDRRDYTVRRLDRHGLTIEFAVHEAGPATAWARAATPGDRLDVLGPKSSTVIGTDVRRWLLIGDETALPAIGRRIETADADATITAIVAVTGSAEEQVFDSRATVALRWVHRPADDAGDPAALLAAVRDAALSADTYVWIAAEAAVARAVRDYVIGRGHPRGWTKAGGYWIKGRPAGKERLD